MELAAVLVSRIKDQTRPRQRTEGHGNRAAAYLVVDDLVPPADVEWIGPRLTIDYQPQDQIAVAQVRSQ